MLHDLRFAFRLLRRETRHTVSPCLTMALANGATTLLFAVTFGVLSGATGRAAGSSSRAAQLIRQSL